MSNRKSENSQANFQSRRNLLKLGTCGAMTNATFLSTLMHLKMTNALLATQQVTPPGGYKALVCLFFQGAIDSFNVLAPYGTTQGDTQYQQYAAIRGGAALKRSVAWDSTWPGVDYGYMNPILDSHTGRTFGLHPRFNYLKQIYDAGHATICANTGALVEPLIDLQGRVNNDGFNNTAKIKPIGLYSHADQQRHWQTAVPTSRNEVRGWGGRMMDLLTDDAATSKASNVYATISTAGQSFLLSGNRILPYTISSQNNGAVLLDSFGEPPTAAPNNAIDRMVRSVYTDMASQTYANILEKTIRNETIFSKDAALAYQGAYNAVTLPTTSVPFGTSGLGGSLASVATAIKVAQLPNAPLNQKRQIFLVQVGGWDHHAGLLDRQDEMIPGVDAGLKAFYDFLVASGLLSSVTLFSISDFSRTLSFNGSGTDHAWGANTMVMGGAVRGGRIYGNYPDFATDINTSSTGLDRGRGVLIPTTSSDQYHAEMCEWFGMPNNSFMVDVLPNIREFYSAGGSHPLGFLNY